MAVTIKGGVSEFTSNHGQRRARLFEIRPVLAFSLYLTTNPTSLVFGGRTYVPTAAVQPSAQSEATGGEDYDTSFQGAITSDKLTNADLNNGVYRGAQIIEYIVDPRFAFVGPIRTYKYYVEDVTWNGEEFDAKCSGVSSQIERKLGSSYTRQCVADLGDFYCGVDLSSISNAVIENIPITAINSNRSFTLGGSIPNTLGDDWFQWGKVQWLLGANRYRFGTIISYDEATSTITLAENTVFPANLNNPSPNSGPDRLTLYAGCDKTQATCGAKFFNFDNFQGQPFVRGSDQVLDAPPS